MPPKRPDLLDFSSLSELYRHFERIFLEGEATSHEFESACGQTVKVFDHHFFHLVKLDRAGRPKPLLMAEEKPTIIRTTSGFGEYTCDRQRAIYLASAAVCLACPDEVWEAPTLRTARWIYIKEFDAKPYAFTIFLVGERDGGPVAVTSFPAKKREAREWRRGTIVFPKNTSATPEGGR